MPTLKRIAAQTRLVAIAFLTLSLGLTFIVPGTAHASITNTRADAEGTVELAGTDWLGGGGVDVYSNGNSAANEWGDNYVGSVKSGIKWQCVEMVNRLYLTKGWTSARWAGNGNTMVDNVPSGLTKQDNGSISYINAGDTITLDDGDYGHAAVINSVGSSIQIVNQNTVAVYSSASITSGSLSSSNASLGMSGWAGYSVQAVVHHPVTVAPTGSPARTDVDNNGGADLFIMTPTATGSVGHSLRSSYINFLAPEYWWNGGGFGWSGVTPLVGDVNGDKKADLVFLTNEGANGTKAFVSISNGSSFGAPQLWWNGIGWGYNGIKATLGDVDNNGGEDLILTTNESAGAAAYVLKSTYGTFMSPALWWNGAGWGWSGITPHVGDVDGDKKADYILLTNEGANGTKAFVAKSNGSSSFGAPQLWWNGAGWGYAGIKSTIGDVDGNGGADLIITTPISNGAVGHALLSTYGTFLSPQYWWNGTGYGWSGITPFTGDINGDKKADFVVMTNEGANGTKAIVSKSNGSAFTAPELWWNGAGWGYTGIKAYLK